MSEQKTKVPGHFFQWFESLKQGYENSINRLFNRVEAVNEQNKEQIKQVYQQQIEMLKKSYQDHLHAIKDSHKAQMKQAQGRIGQLEQDSRFYQDQIKTQHQTIDRLNDRYDAVIFALTDKMDSKELENVIKDISPTEFDEQQPSLQHNQTQDESNEALSGPLAPPERNKSNPLLSGQESTDAQEQQAAQPATDDKVNGKTAPEAVQPKSPSPLQQAFEAREAQRYDEAYKLFLSAAKAGDGKAMGAIGRAHFIGEGTEQDKPTGLAWLIVAAEHNFEPAIKKVASAKEKTPELYQSALTMSAGLM